MSRFELEKLFTQLNLTRNHFKSCRKITYEEDQYLKNSAIDHAEMMKRDHIMALADHILKCYPDCMERRAYNNRDTIEDVEYRAELLVFTKEEFMKIIDLIKNQNYII
jgi:hypothetical protein